MSRIFITGIGIITSIGNSTEENRVALMNGVCGISNKTKYPSKYSGVLPFGEIALSNDELKSSLNIHDESVTRATLLSVHAFEEAIKDARLSSKEISDSAFINATTVGGMSETEELYHDISATQNASPFISSYDVSAPTVFMQKHYGIKDFANTINTACSSSANAIMLGARLIKNGFVNKAIVGGVDCLSKMTINGFNALQILSDEVCKPFDADRKGLNLGEGAAFLVLEKEEDCANKKIYAEVKGYGNANDAFHASSISDNGDGPFLAMQTALDVAQLNADEIDFINAHGTATENNDLTESRAMLRLFKNVPRFVSVKANIGHTLGAAGVIGAAYSALSIAYQEVYPALNFKNKIEEPGLVPNLQYEQKSLKHVMANAFGFGGNCTSLILSKV
ncbi:MAG: beta-ketoacyl-[acyl-carrier-protein] synthase family protein [Arachidicoccus sp.]|nr:beta-ketoacyl-[acyl-carrier-protein] synthase family protein [Arachidicoccus sp.]